MPRVHERRKRINGTAKRMVFIFVVIGFCIYFFFFIVFILVQVKEKLFLHVNNSPHFIHSSKEHEYSFHHKNIWNKLRLHTAAVELSNWQHLLKIIQFKPIFLPSVPEYQILNTSRIVYVFWMRSYGLWIVDILLNL